ncbi:unnamed protein product [Adineta steineri]|uniref:Uncharacterized protein n=1 Tax=Adineta steineri TaxID=433720 RepID=A0A819A3T6_9BILA|nr:unnamed protein product [Adineta steineri]CAF1213538.1 unnamed protein product [Adineta steineri]CAF3772116.1 unnamed protein product [Adineta steineri]CAF4239966.1 unnamed protein product [Adineta steineri]
MLVRFIFIYTVAIIGVTTNGLGLTQLGRCIMSESASGNRAEHIAMGFACSRNPNHLSNIFPNPDITRIAQDINAHRLSDPTQGANRWYSPRLMPQESESAKCRGPIGSGSIDCGGGLETHCGTSRNYKPSWATADKYIVIGDVRPCYYKFYKI